MDALAYLHDAREEYVEHYRGVIRKKREEDPSCVPEVWVQPNPDPGSDEKPDVLCIDILSSPREKPEICAVMLEEIPEGPLIGSLQVSGAQVAVFPLTWATCLIWFCHPDPNLDALSDWRKKWMDPDQHGEPDADGLCGIAHFLGPPKPEGGGLLMEVDLGSAPVDALLELIEAIVSMGATEITIGRSDGTDLGDALLKELQWGSPSVERLAAILADLIGRFPEVERVELLPSSVGDGVPEIGVWPRGAEHEHRVFIANLYLRLQRVGVEARASEIWRFVRGQREGLREYSSGPAIPDLAQLRPVIKDDHFFRMIYETAKMEPLSTRRLVADLWVCYVWDAPNGMRFVTQSQSEQYGLSPEQLHNRALANYLDAARDIQFAEHGPLLVARTGDCYDATLLLDDAFWQEVASKIQGQIVACVPARDIVLIGGADTKGTIAAMREAAAKVSAGGDHLISETILQRTDKGWEVYREAPTESPGTPARRRRPWWRFW